MDIFKKNQLFVLHFMYKFASALFLISLTVDKIEARNVFEKTEIEIDEFSLHWEIHNFSFLTEKTGEFLTSQEFYSENDNAERWVIQFYPRGSKKYSNDYEYVSVLLKCVTSYRSEINIKVSINLTDSKENTVASIIRSDMQTISKESAVSSDRLIKRTDLLEVIPDDTVIIKCNMKVPKRVRNSNLFEFAPLPTDNGKRLLQNLDFTDVTFVVNGTTFHAHKAILAQQSNVFYDMFKQQELKPLVLTSSAEDHPLRVAHPFEINMKSEVFDELLKFIYTKEANVEDFTEDLSMAAEKYELVALKGQCEKALLKKIYLVGQKPLRDHFSYNLI